MNCLCQYRGVFDSLCMFWLSIQELKATNETLRALQLQLEKAFQNQNSGGPTNSTLTAILETKDARIATLEKEVKLLEQELDRLRDMGVRDMYLTSPLLEPLPSHSHPPQGQLSFKHQVSGVGITRLSVSVSLLSPDYALSDTFSRSQFYIVFCIGQLTSSDQYQLYFMYTFVLLLFNYLNKGIFFVEKSMN